MVSSAPNLVRHSLLPKQDQMIFSTERHVGYSGAVGAGKSRGLCIDAVIHCAGRPTSRYGLFRKTLVGLRKSTLKTLIEGDGDAPPVLPQGTYTHNKNDCEIKINGGGSILYSGVETPESVRSMNLSRAGVDEVTELTFEDYAAVDDRVRMDLGVPMQVISVTNPGPPSHWYAKMMGLSPEKRTPDHDCKVILTRTSDNTYLPDAYIKSFERHKGTLYYRRMFLGEWCGSDGLVYPGFNRDKHVEMIDTEGWEKVIGVDDGVVHPFVALNFYIGPDDHFHIGKEHYETGMVSDTKRSTIQGVAGSDTLVIVDSAAKDLILSLKQDGIRATPCDKGQGSVLFGINLVQTLLSEGRLTVDPRCTNTIREFESYEWARNRQGMKDEPLKRDDHAMDPIRYVARYRMEERGLRVMGSSPETVTAGTTEKKSWDDWRNENPDAGWD
jgi:PBSX family phage terminase large subunit